MPRHLKVHRTNRRSPAPRSVAPKSVLFFAALLCAFIVSFLIPLRPTHSEQELRDLTPFPEFSLKALSRGEYFRGIDAWFSDTFPGRDALLTVNQKVVSLYGFRTVEITGPVSQGDDIPDSPFTGAGSAAN